MAPQNAIYNKAAECVEAFKSMTSTRWRQAQLDRFNLWAAHGDIFGSYEQCTSMDWRLRKRPELVDMMLQLLALLHEYLSAIRTLADPVSDPKFDVGRTITAIQDAGRQTQPPSSHTSTSTSSSECSFGLAPETSPVFADPIDTERVKVEQIGADLFRLSVAIRSAGVSYGCTEAAHFVEWQDGVNLTQRFKEGVELLLRNKKPSPSDYMVKRLIETVCLRQRKLACSRRKWMGRSEKEASEEPAKSHGVASLPPRSTTGSPRQGGSGSTTSQWCTIDDSLTNLPLPPEVGEGLEFKCPYCTILFEKAIFQGSLWKNHILEDIQPYICILPDCITPHALYKDSNSWINHMEMEHKVAKWKCALSCQSEIPTFQTEAEFLNHAKYEHKEDFTTEEMLELANLERYEITRQLEVDVLLECPICTISFEGKDCLSVYSHIAEDLAEYACVSLLESPHADANVSQKASPGSASVDDGRIGQRSEGEIEADRTFPQSLWDSDNPETRSDLAYHDADLTPIPEPSDANVTVLAGIRSDIRNAWHERLQQEPDPSKNLLREYTDEPNPNEGEDVAILFEGHIEAASNSEQ